MYCVISLRDVGGSRTTNPDRRLLKRTRTTVAMLRAKNEFTFGAEYTKQIFFSLEYSRYVSENQNMTETVGLLRETTLKVNTAKGYLATLVMMLGSTLTSN